MSIISGEFWITDGGDSTYADGETSDSNHMSTAFEAALGISLDSPDRGQPELIPTDKFDDEAAEWLIKNGASKEAVEYLKDGSDPRDYALEHMGWIRVQGDNFQVWDFNDDALDRIKGFDEWENVEDPEGIEESEDTINIEQHRDNKMWTVSLKELFKAKSAEGLKRYKDGIGKWRNPGDGEETAKGRKLSGPATVIRTFTAQVGNMAWESPHVELEYNGEKYRWNADAAGESVLRLDKGEPVTIIQAWAYDGMLRRVLIQDADGKLYGGFKTRKAHERKPKAGNPDSSEADELLAGARRARKYGDLKAAKLLEKEARRIAKNPPEKEYVIWGIPQGQDDEVVLLTSVEGEKFHDKKTAQKYAAVLEKKYGATKTRVQEIDLSKEFDWMKETGLGRS